MDSTAHTQARWLILVSQAMAVLRLSPEVEDGMRRWIATHTEWMATSEQGKEAQSSGNNLTMWYNAEVSELTQFS